MTHPINAASAASTGPGSVPPTHELAGRTVSQKCTAALKKVWHVIVAIADFVFNTLIVGIFYRLPTMLLRDLPQSLADARAAAQTLSQLQPLLPVLANIAVQYNNPESTMNRAGRVIGQVCGPENEALRANLAGTLADVAGPEAAATRRNLVQAIDTVLAFVASPAGQAQIAAVGSLGTQIRNAQVAGLSPMATIMSTPASAARAAEKKSAKAARTAATATAAAAPSVGASAPRRGGWLFGRGATVASAAASPLATASLPLAAAAAAAMGSVPPSLRAGTGHPPA